MPLVSVVMPVYNSEAYLQAALTSILAQSFRDFDFVIVDDGSMDGSAAILARAAAQDPRIKLISRENRGISASLNEGIAMAQGELIARMDADDIALPDRLARQVAFLEAHPDCGLLGGQILFTDPDDRPLMNVRYPSDHEAIVAQMIGGKTSIAHPAVVARRRHVESVGGYDPAYDFAEDVDLFLRLAEVTRLTNLPDLVLRYRQHPGAAGHARAQIQADAYNRAVTRAAARMRQPPPKPFTPEPRGSEAEVHERWVWWALASGHKGTARHYAWSLFQQRPFVRRYWKLLYCALRGH
jgi:glycosyltransferase involved in cell wall biosynthesis